jgi:hypothetical protein
MESHLNKFLELQKQLMEQTKLLSNAIKDHQSKEVVQQHLDAIDALIDQLSKVTERKSSN